MVSSCFHLAGRRRRRWNDRVQEQRYLVEVLGPGCWGFHWIDVPVGYSIPISRCRKFCPPFRCRCTGCHNWHWRGQTKQWSSNPCNCGITILNGVASLCGYAYHLMSQGIVDNSTWFGNRALFLSISPVSLASEVRRWRMLHALYYKVIYYNYFGSHMFLGSVF